MSGRVDVVASSVAARNFIEAGGGLVGRSEVAALWGVSRQRMAQLVMVPGFPDPVGRANGGWVWLLNDVAAWREERQQRADRARKGVYGRRVPRWMRDWVLERDGGACCSCGALAPLEVDHVRPWADGGPTTPSNLQVLCRPCHRVKTTEDLRAARGAAAAHEEAA